MRTPLTNNAPTNATPAKRRPFWRRAPALRPIILCSLALTLIVPSLTAAPQGDALVRFTYTEYHMGVDARLTVYAPDQPSAEKACAAAFARIAELDRILSDYKRDSELMRLCAKAGGAPVRVSPDLFRVLQRAQQVSKETNGAFDVTVGPLVALWRKARKTVTLPQPGEVARARKLVGWKKVRLFPKTRAVQLAKRGMQLDLGGIGKGYAIDEAQRVLKRYGVTRALVAMGGDIALSEPPPGARGWTIRVPNAGTNQEPVDLPFANCALSTSGDTEQFVIIGGRRYSHIVEPRTGQALTRRTQATIIARNGFTSDPLSKAMCILDEKSRNRLLKAYPGSRLYLRTLPPD